MKQILYFEYDGLEYHAAIDNDELKYYYILNNEKHFDLTKEQVTLMNTVISGLIPSNKLVKTMKYTLNNNTYDVYLDKETHLHLFSPMPNESDLIELNKIFNNMREYLSSSSNDLPPSENTTNSSQNELKEKKEKTSIIKRIINIGTKNILVFVDAALMLTIVKIIKDPTAQQELEQIGNTIKQVVQIEEQKHAETLTDEEYLERIERAIIKNRNLTDEEKQLYLNNAYVYLDNKEYIDIRALENTLSRVDITYEDNSSEQTTGRANFAGLYYPIKKKIVCYNGSSLSEIEPAALTHEIAHSLTSYNAEYFHYSSLKEAINAIFNDEYMSNGKVGEYEYAYGTIVDYTKAIMEIAGPESFKKDHSVLNTASIIEDLCKVIPDEDKAYSLIDNLNIYYETIYNSSKEDDLSQENNNNVEVLKNTLYKTIDEYYYAKNGFHVEKDLVMLYYLDRDEFYKTLEKQFFLGAGYELEEVIGKTSVNRIAYFNTDLKEKKLGIEGKTILRLSRINSETGQKEIMDSSIDFKINNENRYLSSTFKGVIDNENTSMSRFFSGVKDLISYEKGEYSCLNDDQMQIIRLLIEIIGVEPVENAYNTKNLSPVINALIKIDGNATKANELMELINSQENNKDNQSRIYEIIKEYYFVEKGDFAKKDLLMMYYLDKDEFCKKMATGFFNLKSKIESIEGEISVNQIAYFNTNSNDQESAVKGKVMVKVSTINSKNGEKELEDANIDFKIDNENRYDFKIFKSIESIILNEKGEYSYRSSVQMDIIKSLIEIIGVEPVEKTYDTKNLSPIINALAEIDGDYQKASELMRSIESLSIKEDGDNYKQKYENIYKDIKEYYYSKFGIDLEQDMIMLYYLNHELLNETLMDIFSPNNEYKLVYCEQAKGGDRKYFDSNNDDHSLIIEIYGTNSYEAEDLNDKISEFIIDDSNRYLNDTNLHLK